MAASVVGMLLFGVLVLAYVRVKMHCEARNQSVRQCVQVLLAKGSFWGTMMVLAGFFVTLNILDVSSMWGIVRVWAALVVWFLVVAWFVVFKTGTPATVL